MEPLSPKQIAKEPNIEPVTQERISELVEKINTILEAKSQEDANKGYKRKIYHINSHINLLGGAANETISMTFLEFEAIKEAFEKNGWIVSKKPDNYQTTSYKFEQKENGSS